MDRTSSLLEAWEAVARWGTGRAMSLRTPVRIITTLLWLAVFAGFALAAWWLPRTLAQTVERGNQTQSTSVPLLSAVGLRIDTVSVSATDEGPLSPSLDSGDCVWLLGSANGLIVLYDADQRLLVRLPIDMIVTERPCE